MKPYLKLLLFGVGVLCIAAAGNIYYEVLPGLQIKHPITGATTATINGTNGTVTAGFFVGDGSGLTGLPSGGGNMTNAGAATVGMLAVATDTTGGHWTPTNNIGITQLSIAGITAATTATWRDDGAGGFKLDNKTNYTVATLPATATVGDLEYCTDMLSENGVGGVVRWTGSTWRSLTTRINATNTLYGFMQNAAGACYDGHTVYLEGTFVIGSFTMRSGKSMGTFAGGSTSFGASSFGPYDGITIPSGAGGGEVYGRNCVGPESGAGLAFGTYFSATKLPDGTDKMSFLIGFANFPNSTNASTRGVFFIHDPNLYFATTYAGNTNNWIAATVDGAGATYQDTGVAATSSLTAPQKFWICWIPGHAYFWIGGTQVNDITANLPSTTEPVPLCGKFYRHAGSTSASAYFWKPNFVAYRPAAIASYP